MPLGSSISLRNTAESKGSERDISPFHLSPGCIRVASLVFGLVVGFVFVGFVCVIAFGFFARHLP